MLIQSAAALCFAASLAAAPSQSRPYRPAKARRHFITLYADRQFVRATGFAQHPLGDLLGQEVDEVHLQSYQYQTKDNQTQVTVNEFGQRATAIGATVYPFGSSSGPTLAVRGSLETIPDIHLSFTGPAPAPTYEVTGGHAIDVGAGIEMSDRSAGWGLGTHAFVIGGVGRAITDQRDGKRYFAEGGGGIMFGPFGFDIAFRYLVETFPLPIDHSLRTIPIILRGTVSF
jgi:hypothetical protein